MDRWLAVISDLHIGEGVLDDFDQELEGHLVEYLDWLGDRPEPVELVINGDFLDFAQASPWSGGDLEDTTAQGIPLCFTEPQSVGKLTAIQSAHPKIFAALNAFLLRRDENRLVILPGNHDVDFFWPQVRKQFAAVVDPNFKSQQLYFCLDRAYRPAGYSWLWIEHGHQHDQVNSFFAGGEQRWNSD